MLNVRKPVAAIASILLISGGLVAGKIIGVAEAHLLVGLSIGFCVGSIASLVASVKTGPAASMAVDSSS